MKILFIGDIYGSVGRRVIAERVQSLRSEQKIDVCIANVENSAGGRGITTNLFKKFRKHGIDVFTGGNHSFSVPESERPILDNPAVLRPGNYPPGNIGKGSTLFTLEDGRTIGVINLQGRTFVHESLDCPFRMGKSLIEEFREKTSVIIVDFHAEATSEKAAFAHYVDGLASAVLGTHTHVQTADERILSNGTAFITDAGMTGPEQSIIGTKAHLVIRRFLLQTPVRFEPSGTGPMLNAVIMDIDDQSGKAVSISRVYERLTFS